MNLDVTNDLKLAISTAINGCELSVSQICARIYDLSGIEVTPSTLYNWSSVTHPHLPKANIIPAFCEATGCLKPLQVLISYVNISDLIEIQNKQLSEALQTGIQKILDDFKKKGHNGKKEVIQ